MKLEDYDENPNQTCFEKQYDQIFNKCVSFLSLTHEVETICLRSKAHIYSWCGSKNVVVWLTTHINFDIVEMKSLQTSFVEAMIRQLTIVGCEQYGDE